MRATLLIELVTVLIGSILGIIVVVNATLRPPHDHGRRRPRDEPETRTPEAEIAIEHDLGTDRPADPT